MHKKKIISSSNAEAPEALIIVNMSLILKSMQGWQSDDASLSFGQEGEMWRTVAEVSQRCNMNM